MADLSEGWKERPPLQWMVQGYLGIKPAAKPQGMDADAFRLLVQGMNG